MAATTQVRLLVWTFFRYTVDGLKRSSMDLEEHQTLGLSAIWPPCMQDICEGNEASGITIGDARSLLLDAHNEIICFLSSVG